MAKLYYFCIVVFFVSHVDSRCTKSYRCVPLSQCEVDDYRNFFVYPCPDGVLCPITGTCDDRNSEEHIDHGPVTRTRAFPENCGLASSEDKITGGDTADLGQFPWMALLGFEQRGLPTQFNCGGSIITGQYVLTAAHCIVLNRPLELVIVRLGEHNLTTEIDCVFYGKRKVCADRHVDMAVEHVMVHPNFDEKTLKNDIALVKMRHRIKETDFVRTVCLPFETPSFTSVIATGKNLTVSGWGKTNSANLFGSRSLQYTSVTTWDERICNNTVSPEVRPIISSQLCANGRKQEDSCKGDSGGPLVNITADEEGEIRAVQIGIVSFASAATCGDYRLPTIYTRVDKYLNWIVKNVS